MQINRLFEIIYILMEKKTVTAKTLAEHFEVSTRTVYRDIETLSAAGIPVYMSKGKGGGIALMPDFVLDKAVITEREKEEIISALKAMRAVGQTGTDAALQRLGSLFGGTDTDWIEVDFSTWCGGADESELFGTIKSAILRKKVLLFSYANSSGETIMREVCPLKLVLKSSAWYLYAYCRVREDYRFFKLSRMRELSETEKAFEGTCVGQVARDSILAQQEVCHADSLQNESAADSVLMLQKGSAVPSDRTVVHLTLLIAEEAAYRVYDEFKDYSRQPDGSFLVETDFLQGEWVINYIMSFGRYARVLSPPHIRDMVEEELKVMLKNYAADVDTTGSGQCGMQEK